MIKINNKDNIKLIWYNEPKIPKIGRTKIIIIYNNFNILISECLISRPKISFILYVSSLFELIKIKKKLKINKIKTNGKVDRGRVMSKAGKISLINKPKNIK